MEMNMDELLAEIARLRKELKQTHAALYAAREMNEQTDFFVKDSIKKVSGLRTELRQVNAVVSPLEVKIGAIEDILLNRGRHKTDWGWLPWVKVSKIWALISDC